MWWREGVMEGATGARGGAAGMARQRGWGMIYDASLSLPLSPSTHTLVGAWRAWTTTACEPRLPACLPACPPARLPACLPARPPACLPAYSGVCVLDGPGQQLCLQHLPPAPPPPPQCRWINSCVGLLNMRLFLAFLLATTALCFYGGWAGGQAGGRVLQR